jgi:hypothetical protein
MFSRTAAWFRRLFGRSNEPTAKEVSATDKTRRELSGRRERLLYEAIELDDEIQRLYRKWKEADSDLLKNEMLRSLTIKRAEYESMEARLSKIGEAELGMTRRSAFMQSFLDLPEVTDKDLERLESLQSERQERERRAVLYTDKVIGLTEMRPESSIMAEELQQRTVEKLEAEDRARQQKEEMARRREEREREAERMRAAEQQLAHEAADDAHAESMVDEHNDDAARAVAPAEEEEAR